MKEKRWLVEFDEEDNDILSDNAIDKMIDRACIELDVAKEQVTNLRIELRAWDRQ